MRRFSILWTLTIACVAVLTSALTAGAQTPGPKDVERGPVWGYAFAAPGSSVDSQCEEYVANPFRCLRQSWSRPRKMPHVGGGVEWQLSRSLGVLAEAGVVVQNGYMGGMVSANGAYYIRDAPAAKRSLVPFLTGGYSLDPDLANGLNLGGGVAWWGRRGRAIRLEIRRHFWARQRFLEFRVGVNFGRAPKR